MKLRKINILLNIKILLPFVLIYVAEILQFSDKDLSGKIKLAAIFYMLLYVLFKKINSTLFQVILLFLPFFIYGFYDSYNMNASIEDGIRYLIPIIILLYGYSIRTHYKLLFGFLVIFTLLNDFVQINNYINWIRGSIQWFYYKTDYGMQYNTSSGIIRGTGIVGFFGLFGFLNMVSFFIIQKYYYGKYKKLLLTITVISVLMSLSYKTIGTFLFIIFVSYKNKLKVIYITSILIIGGILMYPKKMLNFVDDLWRKIDFYITEGNSARAESYRVMFSELFNFNFFGRGIGSFGGPASVKYNSPLYEFFNFNWYYTTTLATTDTYYPHLFVELGIVGGLMYLFVICIPLIRKTKISKLKVPLIIYFTLLFDTVFSFSLNNPAFLMFSLVFIYPIFYYESNVKSLLE
jgi:hypothetical protein